MLFLFFNLNFITMKKVIVKKAIDALKEQAIKDEELKTVKGGGIQFPPVLQGYHAL